MTSYKTWLYNFESGGKIFDTETPEYDDKVASGYWFDSPAKCRPRRTIDMENEMRIADQYDPSLPTAKPVVDSPPNPEGGKKAAYSKFELSRMKAEERIEIGKILSLDLSTMKREDQINAILEAQK